MTLEPFLSIVVPAFNESRNVQSRHIEKMLDYLDRQSFGYEVLLVNDGSTDATLELLNTLAKNYKHVRVLNNPHQGKALTVKAGMLEAVGENRLYTDFDQSTPISEVEKLLPFLKKEYDVVIGSREIEGSIREQEPWYRHLMGKVFNIVVQLVTVRGIHDTQCGFKLFTKKATLELFPKLKITTAPQMDAFTGAFDVELLFLAKKHGLNIAEVPVHWQHEESERVNPVKDSLRMFIEVIKIRLYDVVKGYSKI